jgi:hypothetical protein
MFVGGDKPLRVKDLQRLLEKVNPNAYILLGGSVSCIDGTGGKLANMITSNNEEFSIYFEDENKLNKEGDRKMLRLKVYDKEDGDIVRALVNEDTKELIMNGSYYDDKIVEKIQGFLKGLDFANIEYELLEMEEISEDHPMYKICRFNYL